MCLRFIQRRHPKKNKSTLVEGVYTINVHPFFLRYFPRVAELIHAESIFIPLGTTHGSIANISIGFIMMYSVFGPKGFWYKLLNLRVINYFGLLSYSLYLWQQIFLNKTTHWINQFPQNMVFVLLAALCSYYLIEKPFLRLKARY